MSCPDRTIDQGVGCLVPHPCPRRRGWASCGFCRQNKAFYIFAGAAPASVYSPLHVKSTLPSAAPVSLQVPEPLIPFIFPVPPAIWYLFVPVWNTPSFVVPLVW